MSWYKILPKIMGQQIKSLKFRNTEKVNNWEIENATGGKNIWSLKSKLAKSYFSSPVISNQRKVKQLYAANVVHIFILLTFKNTLILKPKFSLKNHDFLH